MRSQVKQNGGCRVYFIIMDLPNIWKDFFNLKSSPYFQDPLQKDSSTKSLKLFVGRKKEQKKLLTTIGSSDSSRQAIAGRPGVGKTTLIQFIKNQASKAGYWVADEFISITMKSSDLLLGQILAGVYDAINSAGHGTDDDPAVQEARQLVRIAKLEMRNVNMNASGSLFGLTMGVTDGSSEIISMPSDALILEGPRVLRKLLTYTQKKGAKGVLLHMNNLENLSDADAEKAADRLRDIRDQALMIDGLHIIVIGHTSSVISTVNHYTQVKTVFSHPIILEELNLSDFYQLLHNRYEAFQDKSSEPFKKPIEDSAVEKLYEIFHGDLRNMLRSLEYGTETLLSNCDNVNNVNLPFTLNDLLPVLQKKNEEEFKVGLEPKNWERVLSWANENPESIQTQKDLLRIWNMKEDQQGPVSTIINKELIPAGAVEPLTKKRGREIQYSLTGNAILATMLNQS